MARGRANLVVATSGASVSLADPQRAAVVALDANVPTRSLRTMEEFYDASARNFHFVVVRTVAGMGAMGLLLAPSGLYGLMAFAVNRRTREIGIRMALGALPASVLGMVLHQGSVPTAIGVVGGIAASVAASRGIDAMFPTTSTDSAAQFVVVPVVALVAMTAAYVPARRASRIEPLRAIRQD